MSKAVTASKSVGLAILIDCFVQNVAINLLAYKKPGCLSARLRREETPFRHVNYLL